MELTFTRSEKKIKEVAEDLEWHESESSSDWHDITISDGKLFNYNLCKYVPFPEPNSLFFIKLGRQLGCYVAKNFLYLKYNTTFLGSTLMYGTEYYQGRQTGPYLWGGRVRLDETCAYDDAVDYNDVSFEYEGTIRKLSKKESTTPIIKLVKEPLLLFNKCLKAGHYSMDAVYRDNLAYIVFNIKKDTKSIVVKNPDGRDEINVGDVVLLHHDGSNTFLYVDVISVDIFNRIANVRDVGTNEIFYDVPLIYLITERGY